MSRLLLDLTVYISNTAGIV